jgi:N utilization substance protein B
MQSLYAFRSSSDQTIKQAEAELFHSINKSYDLYHLLLFSLLDVSKYAQERIEMKMQKKMPTAEDLNPNRRFVNNGIITNLQNNQALNKYIDTKKLSWIDHPELIKNLYESLSASDEYIQYMQKSEITLADDKQIIDYFFIHILAESEELYQILEEKSIYWNDDTEFVISMILKTLQKFKPNSSELKSLMPLFKDEEDKDFTKNLFRKAVLNHDENSKIIESHLLNWDLDRVAFIDLLILELALCELIHFPSIPTKVTLNEYIDLARYYSTSKSRNFINGILDKMLKTLKNENKITKAGRGLIGE